MKHHKGFSLIEVTTAIFILTVGVLGVFALIQRTLAFSNNSSPQLTATYLAQEGLEAIRNIRDSNWLEQRDAPATPWDDGIISSDWQVVGFIDGTQSKFQRKITIQKPLADKMIVSVQVSWQSPQGAKEVRAETELRNWK